MEVITVSVGDEVLLDGKILITLLAVEGQEALLAVSKPWGDTDLGLHSRKAAPKGIMT
jgi:hypothetical protein